MKRLSGDNPRGASGVPQTLRQRPPRGPSLRRPEQCSAASPASPDRRADPWQLPRLRAIRSTVLRRLVFSATAAFRSVENRAAKNRLRSRRRAVRPSAALAEPCKEQGLLDLQGEDSGPGHACGAPHRPDLLALPKQSHVCVRAQRRRMWPVRSRPHQTVPPEVQPLFPSLPRVSKTPARHLEDLQALSSSSQNLEHHDRTSRRKELPLPGLSQLPRQGPP